MPDANDMELLGDYARTGSETAFAELVRRHVPLVYSAALRQVGIAAHAEEITQGVFIILARKAGTLRPAIILEGWLYETTRLTALSFLRGERRRQFREQEAYMQSTLQETPENLVWNEMSPLLDKALARLGKKDRDAVILRFFKEKSVRDVAATMHVNESAAQRRILRALEKLRNFLARRGVVLTTAIIAGAISANSVHAAPAGLAKAVSAVAIAKGAAAAASTLTIANAAMKAMAWAKLKLACGIGAAVLVAGSAITVSVAGSHSGQPDPIALLKKVGDARNKIQSGQMEFLVAQHDSKWNIQTNYTLLKVEFDGELRRFEELGREYAITSSAPDASKIVDAKRAELNGDNDALVRLGLIIPQDAHYRTIYDGKAITKFDPRIQTEIHDPKEGSGVYLFDPRTLGLSDAMIVGETVESCLAYQSPKRVVFVGKESVEGTACWHVQTQFPVIVDSVRNLSETWKSDFWIDAAHPTHVIKEETPNRDATVVSIYDPQNSDDPLPIEADFVNHYGGDPQPWITRMIRMNTQYNAPIQPVAFTLAGLDMPVGTDVVDARSHQRVGYWAGTKLSENFPRRAPRRPNNPPAVIENNPASLESIAMDSSYVDERKIMLRRWELGIALMLLVLALLAAIKQFQRRKIS